MSAIAGSAERPWETLGGERRPVVPGPADGLVWEGIVPSGARLHVGAGLVAGARAAVESWDVVAVASDTESDPAAPARLEVLGVGRAAPGAPERWIDFDAGLAAWEGRRARVRVSARLAPRPGAALPERPVAWGPVTLTALAPAPAPAPARRASPAAGTPPNVLFVLVDTLRADHVGAYGYARATTPEIDQRLGRAGARFARAYAQAPWTLPSVASFLLGVYPGEFLGGSMASFALPPDRPTLAERLRDRGYATGAFVANPTVHEGIGFGRGFATYYNPPLQVESMRLSAEDITPRAEAWLAAHARGGRPFFLYVHYIDPHDPYLAPDLAGNRSPFLPDYQGRVAGDWIHGIYNGRLRLEDPDADLEQIRALYDAEIRFVDRHVGRLLASLGEDLLKQTLVVMTADHGEELFDHGGWKHGQTLYEEQIRVPLFLRWDGRIPAGRVIEEPVGLIDLVPTILAAAGAGPTGAGAAGSGREPAAVAAADDAPGGDGVDLLPSLLAGQTLPRRALWARHLAGGALRAAVMQDGRKLMFFNAGEPFAPADAMQSHLERLDRGRLAPVALFDLDRDPGERHDALAGESPERLALLERAALSRLDAEIPGTRVVAAGLPPGSNLDVTIHLEAPSEQAAFPLWLRGGDSIAATAGRRSLLLRLRGDRYLPGRGLLLPPGAIVARVEVGLPGIAVHRQGPVDLTRPGVHVWTPARAVDSSRRADDEETRARLRALGYIQ